MGRRGRGGCSALRYLRAFRGRVGTRRGGASSWCAPSDARGRSARAKPDARLFDVPLVCFLGQAPVIWKQSVRPPRQALRKPRIAAPPLPPKRKPVNEITPSRPAEPRRASHRRVPERRAAAQRLGGCLRKKGCVAVTGEPAMVSHRLRHQRAQPGRQRPDHRFRRRLRRSGDLPGPGYLRQPVRPRVLRSDPVRPVRRGGVVLDRAESEWPTDLAAGYGPQWPRHRQLGGGASARYRMGSCHCSRGADHSGGSQQSVAVRPDGQRGDGRNGRLALPLTTHATRHSRD